MKKQGFALIEGIVIVAVVAIIGALGYVAYKNLSQKDQAAKTDQQSQIVISSPSDLEKVTSDLDTLDMNDQEDVATLDKQADGF